MVLEVALAEFSEADPRSIRLIGRSRDQTVVEFVRRHLQLRGPWVPTPSNQPDGSKPGKPSLVSKGPEPGGLERAMTIRRWGSGPTSAGSTAQRDERVSRLGTGLERRDRAPLRAPDSEAEFVGACLRQPDWWRTHALPVEVFTSYEPRAIIESLEALQAGGAAISVEAVCRYTELSYATVLNIAMPDEAEQRNADVPELRRQLLDLHRRRQLALIGSAAHHDAHNGGRDVLESAARFRLALDEVTR